MPLFDIFGAKIPVWKIERFVDYSEIVTMLFSTEENALG
jgi:hypothetical protein